MSKSVLSWLDECVLYERVSSDHQESNFSIPAQDSLGRSEAARMGLRVVRVFVEAETGGVGGARTEFEAMLRYLEEHPGTTVIVDQLDRLHRNKWDDARIEMLGCRIWLARAQRWAGPNAPEDHQLINDFEAVMGRRFLRNLKREIKKGKDEKAARGYWPTYAVTGYRNEVGPEGFKRLVLDPAMAPLVRQAFERYATGAESLDTLTLWCQAQGMKTPRGVPIRRNGVRKILTRRLYMGEFDWAGTRHDSKAPVIVPADLWFEVQSQLRIKTRKSPGTRARGHAYAGVLRCGACGSSVSAEHKRGRHGRGDYTYYRCAQRRTPPCPQGYVRQERIDEQIRTELQGLKIPPLLLKALRTRVRDLVRAGANEKRAEVSRLRAEEDKLTKRIDAAAERHIDGTLGSEEYGRLTDRYRMEREDVRRRAKGVVTDSEDLAEARIRALELASGSAWVLPQLRPRVRRTLLSYLAERISLKDGLVTVQLRAPFDRLKALASRTPAEAVQEPAAEAEATRRVPRLRALVQNPSETAPEAETRPLAESGSALTERRLQVPNPWGELVRLEFPLPLPGLGQVVELIRGRAA